MGKFAQKLRFQEELEDTTLVPINSIKVNMLHHPDNSQLINMYAMVKATWEDNAHEYINSMTQEVVKDNFLDVVSGKVLPNSMESMIFTFCVENLPYVEITHLLRHRSFFSIHAQCTGDRDLRQDAFYIPTAFMNNVEFFDRYLQLLEDSRKLYADMVDSHKISIMDARYVLPRSSTYFYYFSVNLKDLILFIKQRRCTMIQPEVDNHLAIAMRRELISIFPQLANVVSEKCDTSCHYLHSPDEKNTRLYVPDAHHTELLRKLNKPIPTSVYQHTRDALISGDTSNEEKMV